MLLHCLLTKQKILFAIFSINNFIQPFNAMFKILRYSYNVHWHVWCIHVSLPALTDYFIFFPTTSSSAAASSLLFSWMTDATFCPVVYVPYTGNYACLGRCILHSTLAILWLFFLVFSVVGFVASLLWLSFEFSQKKTYLLQHFYCLSCEIFSFCSHDFLAFLWVFFVSFSFSTPPISSKSKLNHLKIAATWTVFWIWGTLNYLNYFLLQKSETL